MIETGKTYTLTQLLQAGLKQKGLLRGYDNIWKFTNGNTQYAAIWQKGMYYIQAKYKNKPIEPETEQTTKWRNRH